MALWGDLLIWYYIVKVMYFIIYCSPQFAWIISFYRLMTGLVLVLGNEYLEFTSAHSLLRRLYLIGCHSTHEPLERCLVWWHTRRLRAPLCYKWQSSQQESLEWTNIIMWCLGRETFLELEISLLLPGTGVHVQ